MRMVEGGRTDEAGTEALETGWFAIGRLAARFATEGILSTGEEIGSATAIGVRARGGGATAAGIAKLGAAPLFGIASCTGAGRIEVDAPALCCNGGEAEPMTLVGVDD